MVLMPAAEKAGSPHSPAVQGSSQQVPREQEGVGPAPAMVSVQLLAFPSAGVK